MAVQNGEVAAKEVYFFTRELRNGHGGIVLVDGYLYGYNDAILTCLESATGKMAWRDRSAGAGSVTYRDGHPNIQGENNVVRLAEATPAGYRKMGRFPIPYKGGLSWAHPVISDGRLSERNQDIVQIHNIEARP